MSAGSSGKTKPPSGSPFGHPTGRTAPPERLRGDGPGPVLRSLGGESVLAGPELWLDPHRARPFAFVSHAHADHFSAHARILCSTATRRLVESRYGARKSEFLSLDFGESAVLEPAPGEDASEGPLRVELLPAGHIPGSAMLRVERLSDGASLLHTGDFKLRPSCVSETCEPRRADVLVMETTFGLPKFRFPPRAEVIAAMVRWARETLEEGEVPVFLAYSLGKAQEILAALHRGAPELSYQVHAAVEKMNAAVASLGVALPPCERFDPKARSPAGKVLVLPPSAARSLALRRLKPKPLLAMVSGWGIDSGARFRYQCDEVFPLSDHADYGGLLAMVETVDPRLVLTIHGAVDEFARDLRARGREAWPLGRSTQLELPLDLGGSESVQEGSLLDQTGASRASHPLKPATSTPERDNPVESATASAGDRFAVFATLCEEIAAATGRLRKREILARYLASLEIDELPLVAAWLSGKPFVRSAATRSTSVGWALAREALLAVAGLPRARYREISSSQGDAARTARIVLESTFGPTGPPAARGRSLPEIATLFAALAASRGAGAKLELLKEAFATLPPREAGLFVGILTSELRVGLKEGLLEEAIALAFGMEEETVRRAHMLTGDLGETARLASQGRLGEAELAWFTPVKVMLASPGSDAAEIVRRLGGEGRNLWLEDKYDGIRAQIHREGERVEIFSRDLRPLHGEFPELAAAAARLERDLVLDGEIIAWAEGRKLTFHDLQKRLGRRGPGIEQGDLFHGAAVPVKFVAFDLLGIDGRGCLEAPLRERRALLDSLALPECLERAAVVLADGEEAIDATFNEARRRHNEGLVAKDPESPYAPGRRGHQWIKMKKAMPTLDVVVVRAQQGHGKRAHVLSDYTFAVRDEEGGGALRVIGKAYSGLTDLEIEELTAHFHERTLSQRRGVHEVEPDTVLEIAFDAIRPSKRHDSGLALRFPRIKAIRRDKGPHEIDTLHYARQLAEQARG